MKYVSARWNEGVFAGQPFKYLIAMDAEGIEYHIPDDSYNVDFQEVQKLDIQPYVFIPIYTPLTPRQIRLALFSVGITEEMVDTALEGNEVGKIEWKYASEFVRDNPLISALGPAFELTEEQINTLWLYAMTL